jgi:hypothetical protein
MARTTRTKHTSLSKREPERVALALREQLSPGMQWWKARLMARSVAFDRETADAAIVSMRSRRAG